MQMRIRALDTPVVGAGLRAGLGLLFAAVASGAPPPPNLVFILADDLGWADLPVYGNRFNEAPHLDALAGQGMRFVNAYAAAPVCSPTRASIQSGQAPARVGIIDFIPGHWRPFEQVTAPRNRTQYLPGTIVTLAEALKGAGYQSGYFGKWHLGEGADQLPSAQGYDVSCVYRGGGYYAPVFTPPLTPPRPGRLSEVLTDLSIEFIEAHKTGPFFLFLSHYDVHVQLDGDRDLIEKYLHKDRTRGYPGNAVYAAMVEHVDRSVGRIMEKLDQCGLADNTLLIFFSDNGGLVSRFDRIPLLASRSLPYYADSPLRYVATSNSPLRSGKGTVYEGGIREPLIVRWPGRVDPGTVSEAPVSSIDFYPTFLELAGLEPPPNQILDGQSLVPALCRGQFDAQRPLFWHYPVFHHDQPAGAVRKGDWKLVQNQVSGETKLYNLEADIGESTDLKARYPAVANELAGLLADWQQAVGAEFPVPNPAFDPARRFEWGRHPDRPE